MNTHKKVELLFWDCHSSVDIEYHHDTEMYALAVTEYEIDQEKSTDHETKLKPSSVTEIYLSGNEIDSLMKALEYIRVQPEVI